MRNSLTLNYSGDTNIWQDYSYQKSVPKWRVAVCLLRMGISLSGKISVMYKHFRVTHEKVLLFEAQFGIL